MKKYITGLLSVAALVLGAGTSQAVTYALDSGTAVQALGVNPNPAPTWSGAVLNHYTAVAGGNVITSISAVFGKAGGSPAPNLLTTNPVTFVLWNDPNGDGDPTDSIVQTSSAGTLSVINDDVTFVSQSITPVTLGVGQSFFVGVYFQNYSVAYPMAITGGPAGSWAAVHVNGTVDLNNLDGVVSPNYFFNTLPIVAGSPGITAMIRATGVPEPTSALLGLLGCGAALVRRRRR